MSRKPSHIPFFPDAYLRDNYRLSLDQHGLFLVLMMEAWGRPGCRLPATDESLAEIAQIPLPKFRKICGPVLAQWTRDGDKIFQKRLLKEWLYVQEKSDKARASVAMRQDRQTGYERNTNVDTNELRNSYERSTNDLHLGGGEGVGEGSFQEESYQRGSDAREAPFAVIKGGAR